MPFQPPERFNIADYFLDARVREGHGQAAALVTDQGTLTYAEVQSRANRFGRLLLDAGVQPEQRVLLALPDGPDFVAAFFGTLKIGAVVVMVNPQLATDAIAYCYAYTRAHVTVTSRKEDALKRALDIGAHDALPSGGRLAKRVDVVIETVGEATWDHSIKSLAQSGRLVVAGGTSGMNPPAQINRLFFREIAVLGSAMGTLDEFKALCALMEYADIHPPVSEVFDGLERTPDAFRALAAEEQFGKLVVRV